MQKNTEEDLSIFSIFYKRKYMQRNLKSLHICIL